MPFILCATICCCLPCIISILGFREDLSRTRGATTESINALPTYKFKLKKTRSGSDRDSSNTGGDGVIAAGTERERIISGEDAVSFSFSFLGKWGFASICHPIYVFLWSPPAPYKFLKNSSIVFCSKFSILKTSPFFSLLTKNNRSLTGAQHLSFKSSPNQCHRVLAWTTPGSGRLLVVTGYGSPDRCPWLSLNQTHLFLCAKTETKKNVLSSLHYF